MLKPMPAGSTFYGRGGQYIKSLPAQQEQDSETDVFGILDQQYQQEMENIDSKFTQTQEEVLRETRYRLKTLSDKYQQERSYIERLQVPADQKRQKLLQLNNKYELAAITTKSKVKPEMDAYSVQRQQTLDQLQQAYQQKQRDLKMVQALFDKGVIKDPYVKIKEQYEIVGIDYPVGYFRPPKELTTQEYMMQKGGIELQIGDLEEALKTATGEERKAISLRIVELNKQLSELMGVQFPEYKGAIDKSNKLTNVGLQMQAGRKPGTLAEGVWQQKQKKIKPFKGAPAGFTFPYKPTEKKEITQPKYQRNVKTGQTRVSYDGGKTWQTIG